MSKEFDDYYLWAKKLIDNNIFSGDGEKHCSVVIITIMFLCFDVLSVIFDLKNNNKNDV